MMECQSEGSQEWRGMGHRDVPVHAPREEREREEAPDKRVADFDGRLCKKDILRSISCSQKRAAKKKTHRAV